MPLSFSQNTALTCSQCHTPFNAELWLIVDAGERPDLAARCRDGSIHVVACRSGHRGMLGAPLLYHDRAKQQLFLAYPDGMSEQQVQETGAQLVQQLRAQMLILPNTAYLDAPQALPIGLLSAAIDDKLDEVVEQLQQHAAQLEKLRDHPALRVLQEHQALGKTIQEWMNTDSWTESKQFLEAHPELLTNDAELVFAAMLDLARAQEDADAPRVLNEHREILRAARANGIDAAFEKYLARGAANERGAADERASDARAQLQARLAELDIQSQEEFERALPDHPELQELFARVMRDENPILQAIEKLMDAGSPQEVIQLVRAYPLLLDDEGMDAMREIISNARERGDQGTANHLQERLTTLEQIKASGARVEELAEQAEIQASLDDETEAEIRALIEQEHVQNEQEFRAALEKRPDLREKLERAQAAVSRQSSSAALGDIPADVQPILQEISRLTRLSDMPRKIELCRAALERVPREQDLMLWAMLNGELANALNQNPQGSRADNLEQAIHYYEQIQQVYTRAAFPEQWATTQNNLATAYRNRIRGERAENLEEAIRHYELALEVRTRDKFPSDHRQTLRNLGDLYFGERRWSDALARFTAAIQVGDTLFAAAYSEAGRRAEIAETSALYARAAYCLLQLKNPEDALERAEAGKTRLLGEALALAGADTANLPPEQTEALHVKRQIVSELEAEMRLPSDTPARRSDRALAELLRDARSALNSLVVEIRQDHPDFMPLGLTRSEILALAPPDGALIAPVVTSQGSAVFILPHGARALDPSHVLLLDHFTTESLETLLVGTEENPGWLRVYLTRRTRAWQDAISKLTGQLWDAFIAPIHARLQTLGVRRLVLMPMGGLQLLPLHAAWRLVDGAPRYWLDDFETSYAPSAFALRVSRQRARAADTRAALIAGVSAYQRQSALPFTRIEVEHIAEQFGVLPLLDAAATPDAIKKGAPGAAYLHLSCHGAFAWGDDPLNSALYLADEAALRLADILALKLTAQLVTLSACETGVPDLRQSPDEYVGLPAGFLQAGAAGVVSSLWSVNDLSTALLMIRFYENHLQRSQPPAQALRAAQQWLRDATSAELAHTFAAYRAAAPASAARMAAADAEKHFTDFSSAMQPKERPFAHPYHWAAFGYYGA